MPDNKTKTRCLTSTGFFIVLYLPMTCKKHLNRFVGVLVLALLFMLVLALLLVMAACTTNDVYSQNAKAPVCENKLWHETSLFLGRGINTGGEVSEADWYRFLSKTVVPNFPDGFSVVDANGFWNNAGTTEHEKSKILIILHTGTTASHGKIG